MNGPSSPGSMIRPDFRAPRLHSSLVGVLGAVAFGLLAISPASAGSSAANRFHAPFPGAVGISNTTVTRSNSSGCNATTYAQPTLPSANVSSGVVSSSLRVAGAACGRGTSSSVTVETRTGFIGPAILAARSGTYHVSFHWALSYHVSFTCRVLCFATAGITVYGNLYDNTTGRWVFGSAPHDGPNVTALLAQRNLVGLTHTAPMVATNRTEIVAFPTNLTANDTYFLVTEVVLIAYAGAHSPPVNCRYICLAGWSSCAVSLAQHAATSRLVAARVS